MKALTKHRELITVIGVIILALVVAVFNSTFISPYNLTRIANSAVLLILLAVGVTPVIITRNIDVSVGGTLVLSGILGAELLVAGWPAPVVMLVIAALGTAFGILNGVLVVYGHVPSIVATLGTMSIFRGVSFLITGGYSLENIPTSYSTLGSRSLVGIPVLVIAAIVAVLVLWVFLAKTRTGRHVYATGGNAEGATLIGIRTNGIVILAFSISGLFAGLAAIVFIAQVGSISNQAGNGMEMSAIAASVIGGVALSGGVGSVVGALFGAVFITTATSAMQFMGVPGFWSTAVIGAILLIALFADAMVRRRADRRKLEEKYRRVHSESTASDTVPAAGDPGTAEGHPPLNGATGAATTAAAPEAQSSKTARDGAEVK